MRDTHTWTPCICGFLYVHRPNGGRKVCIIVEAKCEMTDVHVQIFEESGRLVLSECKKGPQLRLYRHGDRRAVDLFDSIHRLLRGPRA